VNSFSVLVAGVAIGLAVAAPLGPVNLMVLRASFAGTWRSGFSVGCGALVADTALAAMAAFGVRFVEQFVQNYTVVLSIIAGLVLVVIGFGAVRHHTSAASLETAPSSDAEKTWAAPALAGLLTMINPGTFLGFLAILGGMGNFLQLGLSPFRPLTVVAGIALGGGLWWLTISLLAAKFKNRFSAKAVDRVNHWTGVTIIAFGIVLLASAAEHVL
jgi:arginine exporter protein ArgO